MAKALKHGINKAAMTRLATNIQRVMPAFDSAGFVRDSLRGLRALELKERANHAANVLEDYLPKNFPEAATVIVASAANWDSGDENDPLRGFASWPLFCFVETQGIAHRKISMHTLRDITHLFSAEFAIRPFIAKYPKQAFAELMRWTTHENEQVRRLVSEGIRPRLPWATKVPTLIEDPAPILPLLEKLKDDPALYVRRSVANNLNDIAKDHPDLVLDLCYQWAKDASPERMWIIERATRTLVKDGHPRVWGLLGFTQKPKFKSSDISLDKTNLAIGDECNFVFQLNSTSKKQQRLAIDYAVHYQKANGKTRPKVFKLKVLVLAPGEQISFRKKHSFVERSTRKHYPGQHSIEILVNGVSAVTHDFDLKSAK